ncbi:probable 4-coumarate--CoA ligase 1 [Uranotaenia lowii]|uniref:probable 4-coumarate--CoA ligase 1 n=1 Tax=Uranotaenia lowii TaxID=190385 RepID=UPI0024784D8C|nr:probable 4-coumarate--CoA ligase 1 [Uranotaenia lowii]
MLKTRNKLTFYDETTKIWKGVEEPCPFDPNQSLGKLILNSLAKTPSKITQISADIGVEVTCAELRLQAIRIAQNLTKMGYRMDDVFTIVANNGPLVAPVVFACFALGIPFNSLDPKFTRTDFAHMLGLVQPKVLFCDRETLDELLEALKMVELKPLIVLFGDRVQGFVHAEDLTKPTGVEESFEPTPIEDPSNHLAAIVCSSGTTGPSKGVCLSHSTCIANLGIFYECFPEDIVLSFSSLYWISGLGFLILATLTGATRVITRENFTSDLALELFEKYCVSLCFIQPEFLIHIFRNPRTASTDLSHLRMCPTGGALVTEDMRNCFRRFIPKAELMVCYGFSEAGRAMFHTKGNYHRGNSAGYLMSNCLAKIIDDDGNALDIGQRGELVVKPKYAFMGYYKNEKATTELRDSDGWLHSGDIAWIDEDGFLHIADRKKSIFRFRGIHIYPNELELVIRSVPGVVSVVVAGITVDGTDLPAALVMKAEGDELDANQIHQKMKAVLPDYKLLHGGVYFVDSLPMTPNGKLARNECRLILNTLYHEKKEEKLKTPNKK